MELSCAEVISASVYSLFLDHDLFLKIAGSCFIILNMYHGASLVAQTVKNLPAMQQTQVQFLGWEDPLKKEMATHSSILAWKSYVQRSLAGYSPLGHKSWARLSK